MGSGGNELDVVAERKSEVVGAIQGQTLSEPPWGIEPQTYALRIVSVASAEWWSCVARSVDVCRVRDRRMCRLLGWLLTIGNGTPQSSADVCFEVSLGRRTFRMHVDADPRASCRPCGRCLRTPEHPWRHQRRGTFDWPSDASGAVEGQRACRFWTARAVFVRARLDPPLPPIHRHSRRHLLMQSRSRCR